MPIENDMKCFKYDHCFWIQFLKRQEKDGYVVKHSCRTCNDIKVKDVESKTER